MEISSEYNRFRSGFDIVNVNEHRFYLSHGNCVAFETPEGERVISQNIWGNSTGMHINWLNRDKKIRIPRDHFEHILEELEV
jgi:hypothetical protein